MDLLVLIFSIILNPWFWAIFIPVLSYVILVVSVRTSGFPKWFRRFPLASGAFGIFVIIREIRAKEEFRVRFSKGRRFVRKDRTEIYQTIHFGDIVAPKLSDVQMSGGIDFLEFAKYGADDYRPIKTEFDESGGDYKQKPLNIADKIFYRDQLKDVYINKKYAGEKSLLMQLMPIIIIFITALSVAFILYIGGGDIVEVARYGSEVTAHADSIAKSVEGMMNQMVTINKTFGY